MSESMKCNCEKMKMQILINNTNLRLSIFFGWPNTYENQKISDYDAINQVIKCLEEYKESAKSEKSNEPLAISVVVFFSLKEVREWNEYGKRIFKVGISCYNSIEQLVIVES